MSDKTGQTISTRRGDGVKRSLYLVTGWCRMLGRCRDMIWAADPAEAAARFFAKHKLEAQEVKYEHA